MRILLVIIQFLLFACTLIEDRDITSQEELEKITLKFVEMKIETNAGVNNIKATVTSVDYSEIIVPDGTITKQVWMNWPALTSKLKLKNGSSSSFKSYTSYLQTGKPRNYYLIDSNSDTLEFYRFRYDASGRLNQIITFAPFVSGGPATSRDTIIYSNANNSSEVTSIIRRSSDPAKAGTFTIQSGSFFNLQGFNFQGIAYNKSCQGNGCGPYWGGDYYSSPNSGDGFPYGVMNLVISQGLFYLQDINQNISAAYCQSKCAQGNDIYYLHPLMILKDQFEYGDNLFFMYMVDWWQPFSQVESTSDEKVTFTFKYDL